jgi:thioredoxin-like negative regulator of GroEL
MADTPRIEELRRRVQLDPASIAFAALAEEYRRAGRYDEAIATCTAGLQRHPAYLSAHVTLGRALLEIGQYDEAREELEHVLRIAPENLAAIRGLAEIHHRRGELPESHEHYLAPTPQPVEEELHAGQDATTESASAVTETASGLADGAAVASGTVTAGVEAGPAIATASTVSTQSPAWEYGLVDLAPPAPAPADPVIEGLESLLAAITRARESAASRR